MDENGESRKFSRDLRRRQKQGHLCRERPIWTPVIRRVSASRVRDDHMPSILPKLGKGRVRPMPSPDSSAPSPVFRRARSDHTDKWGLRSVPTFESRSRPMGQGELYEYYKRQGLLDVFFALFPNG